MRGAGRAVGVGWVALGLIAWASPEPSMRDGRTPAETEGSSGDSDRPSAGTSTAAVAPEPEGNIFEDLGWHLTRHTRDRYAADLAQVKKAGVLRVLTRNNSSSYFVVRGRQRGFEYELAQAFADDLGVRVAFVVPDSRDDLIQLLLEGAADMIAAGTTRTAARQEKLSFTRPVLEAKRVLATHPDTVKTVTQAADLSQFLIHTSFRSTTYRTALEFERRTGVDLRLADVADGAEMEEQLARVERGRYEAVIVDENVLGLAQAAGVEAVARWPLGDALPKAWAVHPDASRLRDAADRFLKRARRSGLLRILRSRYFRPNARGSRTAREDAFRADQDGALSRFDGLFRRAGQAAGVDWRLLAAVAYAETRFDPNAQSRWGAQGLMQVLPSTARRVGVQDPSSPRGSVVAGARYLRRLIDFFGGDGVDPRQQVRFALAAYNAGLGHIQDARRLAERIGKDPNKWFNHVEEALKLKQDPRWHRRTRYGYARASETIAYVSRVQAQFDVYARHVPLEASPP